MRLKIKGKTWTVRDADLSSAKCKSGHYRVGECTPSLRLVEINPNQGQRDRMDTLIHELLHAIDFNMPHRRVNLLAGVLTTGLQKDGWRRR